MKTLPILLILFLPFAVVSAEELPYELEKLVDQREQRIAEINRIYRRELEELKIKYTKAGNLDVANTIVQMLRKIDPEGNEEATSEPRDLPATDEDLRAVLPGTTWEFDDDRSITFQRDGTVEKSWGVLEPKWKVENLKVKFEGKVLVFNETFTTVEEITERQFESIGERVDE